jgi:hypothetical protein
LIDVAKKKCALTKFVDDKGTDLLKPKPKFGSPVASFPKFSADRHACLLQVRSESLPARGAKVLALEGTLVLTGAQGQDVHKAKVKLAKGTTFQAGAVTFTVKGSGKPDWGDDPFQVSLEIKADVDPVATLRFLDAAGQEIKSRRQSTMRGMGRIQWDYVLKQKADEATVEVSLWKGMQEVTVPMKLQFGVGL